VEGEFCELRLNGVLRSSLPWHRPFYTLRFSPLPRGRLLIQTAREAEERQQMEKTGKSYSSGEWLVRAGSEEEFIERWNTFLEWTLNNAPGAVSFVLVRSTEDPRRFLSLGAWENEEAQDAWRQMPQMQELFSQCRELCEEFEAHGYTLAASPGH
jgi:quinol monooxygenase YgiN